MKWTIMTIVVTLSVGGALATTPQGDCRTQTQYYQAGSTYMPAGTFGVNYVCDTSPNACTWVTDGFQFFPCRQGNYHPLFAGASKDNKK